MPLCRSGFSAFNNRSTRSAIVSGERSFARFTRGDAHEDEFSAHISIRLEAMYIISLIQIKPDPLGKFALSHTFGGLAKNQE
jgi:hypothetical protein